MSKNIRPMTCPKKGLQYFVHCTERVTSDGTVVDWHVYVWVAEEKQSYRVATFPFNQWSPLDHWFGQSEAYSLAGRLNDEYRRKEEA